MEETASLSPKKGGGGKTTFAIVSPAGDPLHIKVGEVVQLTVTMPELKIEWYVIDQQIAYIYWDGRVEGKKAGTTVVSAFHYKEKGQPYQDNLVVYVE